MLESTRCGLHQVTDRTVTSNQRLLTIRSKNRMYQSTLPRYSPTPWSPVPPPSTEDGDANAKMERLGPKARKHRDLAGHLRTWERLHLPVPSRPRRLAVLCALRFPRFLLGNLPKSSGEKLHPGSLLSSVMMACDACHAHPGLSAEPGDAGR